MTFCGVLGVYRFVNAIILDDNKIANNLVFTYNTMAAGWDTTVPLPQLVTTITGISLPAEAATAGDLRTWLVTNNLITGVTQGIRVLLKSGQPAAALSGAGVDISFNSVTVTR
jgi:hypothetical protein